MTALVRRVREDGVARDEFNIPDIEAGAALDLEPRLQAVIRKKAEPWHSGLARRSPLRQMKKRLDFTGA